MEEIKRDRHFLIHGQVWVLEDDVTIFAIFKKKFIGKVVFFFNIS